MRGSSPEAAWPSWCRPAARVAAGFLLGIALLVGVELRLAGMWPRLPRPDFELDGPLGLPDGRPPLRLVWLGDSTAAGEGASDAAHTLPHVVARGLGRPVEIRVLARPGATLAEVRRHLAPRVAELRPDAVFVSVGANDASHLHTQGTFRRRYRELIAALPPGVPLVILGVPDMGAAIPRRIQPMRAFSEWRGFRLDRAARRVAAETGAVYVNIAGRTGWLFRRYRDRLYAADRYHPGDNGYRVWAEAVLDRLQESGVLDRLTRGATATAAGAG